ncbi:MAG: toll/interleukin-1 receptor domain-containing protein [Planctomycetota bacterium]
MPGAKGVYISYKCGDDTEAGREHEAFVDRLDTSLRTAGHNVRRDKRDIGYKDSIHEFMDELGRGHCIVVVLNNEYLRSRFCMYELVQIYRKDDFRKRIVPMVLPDVTGLTPMQRLKIVKFWGEQRDQHQQELALNLGDISHEGVADFDRVRQIAQNCDAALSHIFDMNCLNQGQLEANDFQLVKEEIKRGMEQLSTQARRP